MFLYLFVVLILSLVVVVRKKYKYWEIRKVPHGKPTFPLGNYSNYILRRNHISINIQELCQQFENEPYIGAYFLTEPVFIPKDPEVIKLIVTKDFHYFNGRSFPKYNSQDPEELHLFGSHGNNWKILRQNMAPIFTSARMKQIFHNIENTCYRFENMLDTQIDTSKVYNIKTMILKFVAHCITGFTFGIDSNMNKIDNGSRVNIKLPTSLVAFYSRVLVQTFPFCQFLLTFKRLSQHVDIFVYKMMTAVMEQRGYRPAGKSDFIDHMIKWKQNKVLVGDSIKNTNGESYKVCLEVNNELIGAQCGLMYVAGLGTTTSTMSFILYELAKHEQIQNKLLEEVDGYLSRHGNKLGYDCQNEMPYLEACIYEALRLYPNFGHIAREVMEDYVLPGGVKLTKGVRVHIPVYYMHHNPKYFKDPEEYRPERFLGEAKKDIVPYSFLAFGEGRRMCIGMRLAKLKMMACLITLLKKYRLELPEDMPRTLKTKPDTILWTPPEKIRIKLLERDGWQERKFV